MAKTRFKVLFTDVGGVIATNGWDTDIRQRMVQQFGLDGDCVGARHRLMFDSYERGNLTLDEYLRWTVFYEPRSFSVDQVKEWMFAQGQLLPGTYSVYKNVKDRNSIKVALISNEGSGLTEDRVKRFALGELADYMIFSCAVRLRKPDPGIWELALALAQATVEESIYIDDRKLFVDFAEHLGFLAYQHTSAAETAAFLEGVGLPGG